MNRFLHCVSFVLVLLLSSIVVAGCDNSLEPISDEAGFSIYGALSLSTDRQLIRVRDLRAPLTPEATETLEAEVFLERLSDGRRIQMVDSVIAFDGVFTHNFRAVEDLQPDTDYRLIAQRPDGTQSTVTARTPPVVPEVTLPDSSNCLQQFRVTFPGITDIRQIRASIGYTTDLETVWVDTVPSDFETDPNQNLVLEFRPESVLETTIPRQDQPRPISLYAPRCLALASERIQVAYLHFGPEWSGALETFDPTESGRVENGLGFFGALRRDTTFVEVDTTQVINIGGPGG